MVSSLLSPVSIPFRGVPDQSSNNTLGCGSEKNSKRVALQLCQRLARSAGYVIPVVAVAVRPQRSGWSQSCRGVRRRAVI
jgi:hypothetical protein